MKLPCWLIGHRPDKVVKLWTHENETHYQANCKNCPHKTTFYINETGRHNYQEIRTH